MLRAFEPPSLPDRYVSNPLVSSRNNAALVAAAATALAGSSLALALLAAQHREPLVLTVLALLAMLGVFAILALLGGYLRIASDDSEGEIVSAIGSALADALVVRAPDGRALFANPAAIELFGAAGHGGVNEPEDAFPGHEGLAQALFRLNRASTRGETRSEDIELPALSEDDEGPRWLRISSRRLHLSRPGGEGACMLWQFTDVTRDRAREAERLRAMESDLLIYDTVPAGVLTASADGRVGVVNATLRSWLGHPSGGLERDLRLNEIVAGEGPALLRSIARDAGNETQRFDLDLIHADGTIWPASLVVLAPAPTAQPGAVGHCADIKAIVLPRPDDSEQPQTSRAVEARFARFFQSAPLGIATIAADGTISSTNPAFSRLLLGSRGLLGGVAIDVLARGASGDARRAIEEALAAALAGRANIPPVEITLGANRELTRRAFFTNLGSGKGDRDVAILYLIDATEQKALEINFAQSQKMEAVGKLAGGIAHDFNNVLTAIIGFSDLLLTTHQKTDPAWRNIMNIRSSAQRAAGMVEQLLAFSRKQTLQPTVIQLGEALTDMSVLINRLLGETIELKILPGRDLWSVKADKGQLSQVILNLAVNARDAMPEGGRLTIRTRNITERETKRLGHPGMALAEYVLIEVEDTGTGMTPEVLAKIFEPFFTTKGVGKGTGLGLATVYGIVKQTGGYVYPESAPGKGTTFRVYLPRYEADSEELPAVAVAAAADGDDDRDMTGTGRVLVVEDEDAVRTFAVEALKRQGYEVLEACDGVEAIEIMDANDHKVDLVVSDVIMPEMNGPTLLKELRKKNPHLKFIFVSGYPDDEFKNNLDPNAAYAFLQKPYTLAQIAERVKEEIRR